MAPYKVTPQAVMGRMNLLIYGNQGCGKTALAATAQDHPDMGPVLVANTENGMITLAKRGDIDAEDIRTTAELEQLFWKLANKDPEYVKYKTLIIDSVTELQEMNMRELVEESITKNAKYQNGKRSVDDRYQEDYGKSTAMLKRIFRMYRDLDMNVIMTALPKEVYQPGDTAKLQPTEVCPFLTNKLSSSLMGYVDFVWYLYTTDNKETGKKDRHLLTQDFGVYRAKTRGMGFSESIGIRVDNPHLGTLYDIFKKSEEK